MEETISKMLNSDRVNSSPLWANVIKKQDENEHNITKILRNIPLFVKLSKRERKKLSRLVYERNYKPDEYLFREGNPGSGMFIIKNGSISIERTSKSGEIMHLAILSSGDFVGELALLDDSPRSASARCKMNTTIVAFFRQDFFNLIAREPSLGSKILKELAIMIGDRLKETNEALLKYTKLAESLDA